MSKKEQVQDKVLQDAKELIEDTKSRIKQYFTARNIIGLLVSAGIVAVVILALRLGWVKTGGEGLPWQAKLLMSVGVVAGGVFLKKALDMILVFSLRGSAHAVTIERMIHSFIKYVIAIIAVIVVLVIWLGSEYIAGVLGGVGVLALVIGLGAQKLIGDVIAGVFMVFEGNISVGDIVTINDWRGTVKEIGIRSTVLVADNGNMKVLTNSVISEFVNLSRNATAAVVTTCIDYATPVEQTERVIKEGLQRIKDRIPDLADVPAYKGIENMGDNGYEVKVIGSCQENKRFQVQRDLTKELMLVLQEGGVLIAYPQIDVHTRND